MTRLLAIGTLSLGALAFAGCGDNGSGDDEPTPDAPAAADARIDAPPASNCTEIEFGTVDTITFGEGFGVWFADVPTDLGDGGAPIVRMEFLHNANGDTPVPGVNSLTDPPNDNYATCTTCFLVVSPNADGSEQRFFLQNGGSIDLADDPAVSHNLDGTLSGLTLQEVTIDFDTFESTPVPDGECLELTGADLELLHNDVPNAWTCDDAAFEDGVTCDCACGGGVLADPDCSIPAAPIAGCDAGNVCFDDACFAPPTNDTCQTFEQLTIGVPVNGLTVGATGNYDAGLESCTGFAQPGNDVAYRIALTAGQNITVTLSNLTFDGAVALIRRGGPAVCDAATIQCQAGADAGVTGDDETFTFTATQAGNYWILVDSWSADVMGTFTLVVENTP
jgi:hypothetical protein